MRSFLTTLILLLLATSAQAQSPDLNEFEKITVLEQGRYKPLSSYARNLLLRFSGKSKLAKLNASQWLAQVLFEPEEASKQKVFLINDPQVLESLDIEPDKHRRYSFEQLEPSFEKLYEYAIGCLGKEEQDRTELDKEFLRVYTNFNSYHQLINSFSMFLPHRDFELKHSQQQLGLLEGKSNLYQIMLRSDQVQSTVANIELSSMDAAKKEILGLGLAIYAWVETHKSFNELYKGFDEMQIILDKEDAKTTWQALLETGGSNPHLAMLNQAYQAYLHEDQALWQKSLAQFNQVIKQRLGDNAPKTKLEQFYTKLNPFGNAKFLYGFGFLLLMLSFLGLPGILRPLATLSTGVAFFLHLTGLVSRMIILERPPVTNLFETFVFVSLVTALIGMVIYFLVDNNLGLVVSSFVALVLLLLSGKFASDGDTMQVLIAVLDSNFWLSTHVVCISIGYAGVFTAGVLGHVYLIRDLLNGSQPQKHLINITLGTLAFGLCFSFLGTMLGGIWADQSWGRFWGWDPKENGALLIVLWTAIIFHARLAGMIKDCGTAICSALGAVVVITSWFGINLLGVGLHSYGFTSGLALGLYIYYGLELIFISLVLVLKWLRRGQDHLSAQ